VNSEYDPFAALASEIILLTIKDWKHRHRRRWHNELEIYFGSQLFEDHCDMAGLDAKAIREKLEASDEVHG